MLSWEISELDDVLGGLKKHSLVLIHEKDPRSRGKEVLYYIMRKKLEGNGLVGYFNISYPIYVLFRTLERAGISYRDMLKETKLAIIDTFGSFYDVTVDLPGVWYLKGTLSADVLPAKYSEVIRAHKEKWAELGMFKGRELYGFSVDLSDYISMLGGEKEALKYLELSAEVRRRAPAYRKYPTGTNFWLWSGEKSVNVLMSIYRRASYVLRTKSHVKNGRIIRTLEIVKAPNVGSEVQKLEYRFRGSEVLMDIRE